MIAEQAPKRCFCVSQLANYNYCTNAKIELKCWGISLTAT